MPETPYIQHRDGTVREGRTVPPTAVSTLEVEDRDLSFVRIDHQVRLQFGGTEVVIESPFTVAVDGVEHTLDPADRGRLGPLVALYPDVLSVLAVGPDATLRIELESGASVTVPPDPSYEAWQVSGPGGRLVVCRPGGQRLSVWT